MINKKNYKVVFLGALGVGKTSIILRLTKDEFYNDSKSTIGVGYYRINTKIDKKEISYDIWDTAGQEAFADLIEIYYRNVDISVLIYDITCEYSYNKMLELIEKVKSVNNKNLKIIIVGNKNDLQKNRIIDLNIVLELVRKLKCFYIETSAKNSYNISKLFDELNNNIKNNISLFKEEEKLNNKDGIIKIEDSNNNYKNILKNKCCAKT